MAHCILKVSSFAYPFLVSIIIGEIILRYKSYIFKYASISLPNERNEEIFFQL